MGQTFKITSICLCWWYKIFWNCRWKQIFHSLSSVFHKMHKIFPFSNLLASKSLLNLCTLQGRLYIFISPTIWHHIIVNPVSDPSRVVYTPTIQYLPLHLSGVIHCHIESHPPFQFITWTKDKRIFDPFEMEEIQTLTNGSLLITKVKTLWIMSQKIFQSPLVG